MKQRPSSIVKLIVSAAVLAAMLGLSGCGAARNMKVNGGQNVTDNR